MNFSTMVTLASRNTLRRRARSAFTAGMVLVSVALLLICLTMVNGIFEDMLATGVSGAGEVRIAMPEFVKREETQPLYANLADVDALAKVVAAQPGVTQAEPRIMAGVTVTIGEEIGDVFAKVVGANDGYFVRSRAKSWLVAGRWFDGGPDELVAGQGVVDQLHAKVGDEVVALGSTQDGSMSSIKGKLVGIVHGAGVDQSVLVPLDRAQYLTDLPEAATELLVYGTDLYQAPLLAKSLAAQPMLSIVKAQPWNERDPWRTLTASMDVTKDIIVFIIGLLTALGIWNTMTMTVLERTSELGVLRAMGMGRARVVWLVVTEAVAISVVGALAGLLVGGGPALLLAKNGIHYGKVAGTVSEYGMSEVMYGKFTVGNLIWCFGLGVAMALLGSFFPALQAASIQPVNAMRTGK